MRVEKLSDGVVICGDASSQEVLDEIKLQLGDEKAKLIVTDPPYGNVIDEEWDKWNGSQKTFVDWMIDWTRSYSSFLVDNGAMYVWGGYGVPGFRPFFEYVSRVEAESVMRLSNFVTWSKKRAYGVQHNYLATREDLAYLVKGNVKKPATFNVPYLETKRGYAGYNSKYPAKSEFYRRTNVWMDVTEIFAGKVHPTQKPLRVYEIPIEVNTNVGDWIIDPFGGSMTAAFAARKLERRWICVEKDPDMFDQSVEALKNGRRKR